MITREKDLYKIWQSFCRQGGQTSDKRLAGIEAGQPNYLSGPDFQGAEFELDGRLYRGDVEIHLKAGDWYTHQHHLDDRYSQVLLHLVWDGDPDICILNNSGRQIPTLSIRSFPALPAPGHFSEYCRWQSQQPKQMMDTLRILSLQRLQSKHQLIGQLGNSLSYDQILYLLFLRILGQPHNVNNFLILANHLPWKELMNIKERYPMSPNHWLALLAIQTGLIEYSSKFRHLRGLQPQIEAFSGRRPLGKKAMSWQFSGQRPGNNPVQHLTIFADWLHHFKGRSLYFELKQILARRLPETQAVQLLDNFFSLQQKVPSKSAQLSRLLWGKAKRTEIIGNMVLPFFHLESAEQGSEGFIAYLESLYLSLPFTGLYKPLHFFYSIPGLDAGKKNRFFFNQGLLYLKSSFCEKSLCHICPFEISDKDIDKNDENI
jgi:hypothetical protein